jgi:NADH:ubiquinone oxidoreductase subunit D
MADAAPGPPRSRREQNRSEALAGTAHLDLNREPYSLELGPHHPAIRGALGLRVELDGERILALEVSLGYGHQGFEAQVQDRRWHQAIPYVERLQSHSSMMVSTAYCLAVEEMLSWEAPLRSAWLRVLGGELGRAADHLGRIATLARVLGADAQGSWALNARARLWSLLERLSGAPTMHHYVRLGGVSSGLPPEFGALSRFELERVLHDLEELDTSLGQNRAFIDRLGGRGKLSAEECLAFAVTGPTLRAAGVASDLRRSEPYLVYDELVFDLPVGLVGDNLDRYRVCVEEIRQSLSMVAQCVTRLEALGPGEFRLRDPWLDRNDTHQGTGALADRVELASAYARGPSVPPGEGSMRVESANGEFGFSLISDGGSTPRRVRCRAPSFFHAQALPAMLVGQTLEDVAPTLALVNIEGAECDR